MGRGLSRVEENALAAIEPNWVEIPDLGLAFTKPNFKKYGGLWLHDECYHDIALSGLESPSLGKKARCVQGMTSLLSYLQPSGFLPNEMRPLDPPEFTVPKFRTEGRSSITQPPMLGHALRVMQQRGFDIDGLPELAQKQLLSLYAQRLDPGSGLLKCVHPWETGCDNSQRWDAWLPVPFHFYLWKQMKRRLLKSMVLEDGCAISNPRFEVCSAGFNALAAFNARELYELTKEPALAQMADTLIKALEQQWDEERGTWVDVPLAGRGTNNKSSAAPVIDALLPVLVTPDPAKVERVYAQLNDERQFKGRYGLRGTSLQAANYDPDSYWRGGGWPHLQYHFVWDATRRRRPEAREMAITFSQYGLVTGNAEYANMDTGTPLGAIPQGWAAIAAEGERMLEQLTARPINRPGLS